MARFNPDLSPSRLDTFDRLPRRVQIVLLMLVVLVPTVISFWMGMDCLQTGKPIVLNHKRIDAGDSFLYMAGCLVVEGGLFAVLMGWAKSRVEWRETRNR